VSGPVGGYFTPPALQGEIKSMAEISNMSCRGQVTPPVDPGKLFDCTAATSWGSAVISSHPQTKRGRTTMTLKDRDAKERAILSASPFVLE
jgi:hypothetical protein